MSRFVASVAADMIRFNVGSLEAPGSFAAATSTYLKVVHSDGYFEEYFGSGFVASQGEVSAGTVTAMRQSAGATVLFDLTGFSVPAVTFARWVETADNVSAFNTLFGAADEIVGSAVADTLLGYAGADSLTGGGGNDVIDGNTGGDTILGGDGADTVRGLEDNDQIDGGAGNDDLNGNTGADTVRGGDGADFVRGGQGADSVYGDAGDDPHVNGNIGDDQVFGGDGNDSVYGGQGNDTVSGEAGADLLSGDLGNDILVGGAGADRFAFLAGGGIDYVSDFNAAEGDRVKLAPGQAYTVENVGGQVFIGLGGGHGIGLAGVAYSSFSADWVVFS